MEIQEIMRHLYIFVNYQQDNYTNKLPMAEFAINNNISISIKLFPFFASRTLYLRISFDIINLLDITTREKINKKKAMDISITMQLI